MNFYNMIFFFHSYAQTKCNQYYADEARTMGQYEMFKLQKEYDIEEALKKKLIRIKNSNHSKQGKIQQENLAKKAADDARKAMQKNYRQQQVNNFVQIFVLPIQ